jgi:hypothetical protein
MKIERGEDTRGNNVQHAPPLRYKGRRKEAGMRRIIVLTGIVLLAATAASMRVSAADGSKGRLRRYEAHVRAGQAAQGDWNFVVELEPILFRVVALQNKYRVLRINIVNRSDAPLRLSAMDKVQLQFRESGGPRTVDALLDVSQSDRAWWSGLPQELRSALAYPDQAPIRRNEEENVFAFIPIASASTLPTEILFTVNSYSSTPVTLRELVAAAL